MQSTMAENTAYSKTADTSTEALRVPPHSLQAEQSVLGGLMLDNETWDRVADRATFLGPGETGEWDPHFITFSDRPILFDEEMWFYYGGRRYQNGRVIEPGEGRSGPCTGGGGLATLRRDGFCSLGSDVRGGYLRTRPFRLPQGELKLNCKSDFGAIRVILVPETGSGEPVVSRDVREDSCSARVEFDDIHVLPGLIGRPVRLRFDLKNALLYSFRFE